MANHEDAVSGEFYRRRRSRPGAVVRRYLGHSQDIVSSAKISLIIFVIVFGGAIVGMFLRAVLPQHHLQDDSRDVIKMGIGLVATMAALVLGLLVASAKSNYDTQSAELTQMAANIALFDRVLASYGPETKEVREALGEGVIKILNQLWAKDNPGPSSLDPQPAVGEILFEKIEALSPRDDSQRFIRSQALSIAINLGQTRYLMYTQSSTAVSRPLLIVIVIWLTVIFLGWGLLAPPNTTLIVTVLVSALSVSSAMFLILEMYSPYHGWIQLSDAPLRAALARLAQ